MKKNSSIENWQAAQKLFEKYLDQPVTQSIEQINLDKNIPNLVKSKLIKLIQSQSDTDTVVDSADLSLFHAINMEEEDLTGKSIGGYKLIARIGHGGMSYVYKAERKNTEFQKFVALKLIRNNDEDIPNSLINMFEQEQLTLSKLNHPNIISFHHGGISTNGIPFLVMDYIEQAIDIKDYASKQSFSSRKLVELIQKIADAISFAHQNFIIHKDIKPNNILIDKHGVPKVVDFGIASVFADNPTQTQQKIFTPDYASPEQILGNHITPNSDVFSLSAVLLELLTQQKPLPHIEVENYKPAEDISHINTVLGSSTLENDLKNILIKGLKIDPQERYQTMQQFNDDLDGWLKNKPVLATKPSLIYLSRKYFQRHKVATIALLSLVVSVVVGIVLILQQRNHAQLEALKAQQVTDFLIQSIQASDPDLTKGKDITVKELLHNAKLNIQQSTFSNKQLATTLEQTIGLALLNIGEYKDAEKLLIQSIQDDKNNFKARINLAQVYLLQKLFNKTKTQLTYLESNTSKLSFDENIQHLQISAEIHHQQGEFESALNKINQALTLLNNKPNKTKLLISNQLIHAKILSTAGELDQSIQMMRSTLTISQNNFGDVSTSSTNISMLLAEILTSATPLPTEEILKLYYETLDHQKTIYGDRHPIIAKTHLQLGFAQKTFGQLDEALANALLAKEIALFNFGNQHMLTAHINLLISQLNVYKGNIDGAIIQLNDVVTVYEQHYGPSHYETNQTKTTLSVYLIKANRAEDALKMLLPLYESQKHQLGEFNKATFYAMLNILKSYNLLGNHKKAITKGVTTLKSSQENLGHGNMISIGLQMVLTESYLLNNNPNQAIKLCQDLLTIDLIKNHPGYNKRVVDLLSQAQSL